VASATSTTDAIAAIERGFARTPHPGAAFLQGSFEGCEPAETVEPFRSIADWRLVPVPTLDGQYTALSFLSEGGFRFFLPAWMVADLRGLLATADPLFHLTAGFTTTTVTVPMGGETFERGIGGRVLVNPRRYGAMTSEDAARHRLSVFCREEARAIVAYLACRRERDDSDLTREAVDAALGAFWRDRAAAAPTADELEAHVEAERAFGEAISRERQDEP
jgi:hypothetical protein